MLRGLFSNPSSPEVSPSRQRILANTITMAEELAYAGERNGPRVYTLTHDKNREDEQKQPLKFIAFGCQGSGNSSQKSVAALMNKLCADPDKRPDFILVLGDNVYDHGADHAGDKKIKECFDDIYLDERKYPNLKGIPFFVLLGNHDENRQNAVMRAMVKESGVRRGMHEVAHSYMPDKKYDQQEKERLYHNTVFHLNDMPAWNMPHRYYALIAGDTQIFCVDSSTYVREYLQAVEYNENSDSDYQSNHEVVTAENNQALWLEKEIRKAKQAGRKVIVAQHHPIKTPGKNAYHNDVKIYLNADHITDAQALFQLPADTNIPYSTYLYRTFARQNLPIDVLLTAHDHNIYNYNNNRDRYTKYKVCQLTCGGGGGDLQERAYFLEQNKMGCFLKRNGVSVVSHKPNTDEFVFDIHTVSGLHLKFTNYEPKAIVDIDPDNPEKEELEKFFAAIQAAVDKYISYIGREQHAYSGKYLDRKHNPTGSHGKTGIDRVHDVWAYISKHKPSTLEKSVDYVYNRTKWENTWTGMLFTTPGNHSLIKLIDDEMQNTYGEGMTLEAFYHRLYNESLTKEYEKELSSSASVSKFDSAV